MNIGFVSIFHDIEDVWARHCCLPLFLHRLSIAWVEAPTHLAHWPIGLTTFIIELPWPIRVAFTSYWSHRLVGRHSGHVGPLDLLSFSLGFLNPYSLYLLLIPWACWLPFLPRWPIGFITSFLGVPRSIYIIFTSY